MLARGVPRPQPRQSISREVKVARRRLLAESRPTQTRTRAPCRPAVSCGLGVLGGGSRGGCALTVAALAVESALTALADMSVGNAVVAAWENVAAEVSANDVAPHRPLINSKLGRCPGGPVPQRSVAGLGCGSTHRASKLGPRKTTTANFGKLVPRRARPWTFDRVRGHCERGTEGTRAATHFVLSASPVGVRAAGAVPSLPLNSQHPTVTHARARRVLTASIICRLQHKDCGWVGRLRLSFEKCPPTPAGFQIRRHTDGLYPAFN